jgi:hypothetical protein
LHTVIKQYNWLLLRFNLAIKKPVMILGLLHVLNGVFLYTSLVGKPSTKKISPYVEGIFSYSPGGWYVPCMQLSVHPWTLVWDMVGTAGSQVTYNYCDRSSLHIQQGTP